MQYAKLGEGERERDSPSEGHEIIRKRAWTHQTQTRTHTHERSRFVVSPGQRLADHWAKDSDLSAGYILAPEIDTDITSDGSHWSATDNQDVSREHFGFTHWLPAGLSSPTVPRTQRPIFFSLSPHTHHTHTQPFCVWSARVKCQNEKGPFLSFLSLSRPVNTCRGWIRHTIP